MHFYFAAPDQVTGEQLDKVGPVGALVLLLFSILVPAVVGVLAKRAEAPKAAPPQTSATPAAPPLPTAVEGGVDLAKRYFDKLEERADAAEVRVTELTARLEQERQRANETQMRMQRDLDAAQFEITQLREQVRMLTWRQREQ